MIFRPHSARHSPLRIPILLAALLLAMADLATLPAAQGKLRGRIRGTARDLKGRPVAGLQVQLLSPEQGFVQITNTDDRGIYSFEDLQAGTYDVEMGGSGYQRQVKKGILVRPPFRNIVDFSLPPGPVTDQEPSSPVVYQPPPGEALFRDVLGEFTDKDRHPIPDVTLSIVNPVTGASFRAQSDREGKVLLRGVPVGTYRVAVSSPGYVTVELKDAEVSAASGMSLKLSLVEYPLSFKGRPEDLVPQENPVPPDYRPPGD
jgi:Carboxypeptidase regulatory-like domain